MTRRSPDRSTPRTSDGRWGSIRLHCSSLSQNRFLRTARSPKKTNHAIWNQDRLGCAADAMSSDPNLFPCARPAGFFSLIIRSDLLGDLLARFCHPPAGSVAARRKSVPIAGAPCGGSQPCRAPATLSHSPVTRHDCPADVYDHHARPPRCGQQCLHRYRAANRSLSSGMPSVPALEINAIVPHSSRAPAVRTNKSPSARSHQASSNIDHQRATATIPIVPNLPRFRSIRLL